MHNPALDILKMYCTCAQSAVSWPVLAAKTLSSEPSELCADDTLPPLQPAALQSNSDHKPEPDTLALRRRQSFNFGDNRLGPTAPSDAKSRAPFGRPPGDPSTQLSTSSSAAPASAAVTAVPARPLHRTAMARSSAQALAEQASPGAASKLPQPAQKPELKRAVVQKKGISIGPLPKTNAQGQTTLPATSHGEQSLRKPKVGGDSAQVQRQDSSLAQLVEKYKTDSAARKQANNEVTLERINSMAAGLQHAASGRITSTSRASPSVHKQVIDAAPAVASSSRRHSPMQAQVASAPKPQLGKAAHSARPLQAGREMSVKSIAKGKQSVKRTATASGSKYHEGTRNSSDSDD